MLDLENLVADVTRVVSKLGDTIRKHRLFDYPSEPTLTVTKPGGVPHTTKRRLTDEEKQRRQEKFFRIFYDRFLNESIRFRDECHKALFKVEE